MSEAPTDLRSLAIDVVEAWNVWCSTEGWDNAEWDALAAALVALEKFVEPKEKL